MDDLSKLKKLKVWLSLSLSFFFSFFFFSVSFRFGFTNGARQEIYEAGLITKEEYDAKKKPIVDNMVNSAGTSPSTSRATSVSSVPKSPRAVCSLFWVLCWVVLNFFLQTGLEGS